jgi:hypothetical protein
MPLRTLFLSLLIALPSVSAQKFKPEFFAFENGVRFGQTEQQIQVLKELGDDSLGSAKPGNLAERLVLHKEAGIPISSLYIGGKIGGNQRVVEAYPVILESSQYLKGHGTIIELYLQRGGNNTDEEAVTFAREVAGLAKVVRPQSRPLSPCRVLRGHLGRCCPHRQTFKL